LKQRSLCLVAAALAFLVQANAADEKKPEKKEPPQVTAVIPFTVVPGTTNKLKVRGLNLTNVTEARFAGWDTNIVQVKSKGKAEMPKEAEAKKWGDTQVELELKVPADAPPGTNSFTLVSPQGESSNALVIVVPPDRLIIEKEPNGSFKQAQSIEFGKTVQGVIGEAKDVDVFRCKGQAGKTLSAEVFAARFGSLLDPVLTVYDDHAHILAVSDDSDASNDAAVKVKLPADGNYCISVIDASDRGGQPFIYNLIVNVR